MYGTMRSVCQGGPEVIPELRQIHLQRWFDEIPLQPGANGSAGDRAAAGARRAGVPCVHLGPATGELRDCASCQGNVRSKLFACAVHGDCTLKDCQPGRCRDYLPLPDDLGGLGPGAHSLDHYALTFPKGARPALYTGDGRTERTWENLYEGETFFFLGGGPSLLEVDLAQLEGRRAIAVNSVCELFPQPTVWIGVDPPDDPPDRYRAVPWADPHVLKLLPRSWAGADTGGMPAYERPHTRFFLRNHRWAPWQFLTERTVNWGADKPYGAGRSVMLAAIRLAYHLGARRIVLLGADFHMDPERPYCHSAPKDERGCNSNNSKFGILERRLRQLRPYLERAGLAVVNATVGSRLEAFDRTTLESELARCSS
jgi:hypothetical protein